MVNIPFLLWFLTSKRWLGMGFLNHQQYFEGAVLSFRNALQWRKKKQLLAQCQSSFFAENLTKHGGEIISHEVFLVET